MIVRRRAYFHHGIYAGNGRVIHYAGWFRSSRGLVEEVTLDQFTQGRRYRIGRTPPDRPSGEAIVLRARSRLGERRYHLLRNNCEHFCNWCQLGERRSEQVEALMKPALSLIAFLRALLRELAVSSDKHQQSQSTQTGGVVVAISSSVLTKIPPRYHPFLKTSGGFQTENAPVPSIFEKAMTDVNHQATGGQQNLTEPLEAKPANPARSQLPLRPGKHHQHRLRCNLTNTVT